MRFGVGRAVRGLAGLVLLTGGWSGWAAASLSIGRDGNGLPRVSVEAAEADWVVLETSPDLLGWQEWLRGQGSLDGVADLTAPTGPGSFFRARTRSRGDLDDWKNVIRGTFGEPFQSEAPPPWNPASRWIKFALPVEQPGRVYFQDSSRHLFHYDFAVLRLPGFAGLTRAAFDAVTLRTNGQRAVLGAVLFPPSTNLNEVAIQFVGQDSYSREAVLGWFRTVRSMIQGPPTLQVFYSPTFEQAEVAHQNAEWFLERGVPVGSASRWVTSDECYSPGWALGRLVYLPAAEIPAAYQDGRLGPTDILLADGIPAELPPLAGIVSLSPATPNSHVALLAKSFGIPFVHLAGSGTAAWLKAWNGREVMVRAIEEFAGCEVRVSGLARPVAPEMRREILALKTPPKLNLPIKQRRGVYSLDTLDLGPADSRHVGGKAANLGVLRRAIPTNAPSPAIAFTFDLWDDYLDQVLPDGRRLRVVIGERLGGFAWPPDMARLQTALDEVRRLFTNGSDFPPDLKGAVLEALDRAGFDPRKNIRFRSSTNVEDGEWFSGAGLYDSYSGCLADDLDGDGAGPSHCDPTERNERGVFRALRRVYASFYNQNAFLERLRHGVNEADVGMAVLVHESTPDPIELANGVATLRVRRDGADRSVTGSLVTQAGAVSVANPDGTARPERVTVTAWPRSEPYFEVAQASSLVPLGGTVLRWPGEYGALSQLLDRASRRWESELPGRTEWILDFEYKKIAPDGHLGIKQIRPLPVPAEIKPITPWLLDATNRWVVLQGEHGDVMALHRLKSFWSIEARHARLTAADLGSNLLQRLEARWLEGTNETTVAGPVAELPGHRYNYLTNAVETGWEGPGGARSLRVSLEYWGRPQGGPLVSLADLGVEFARRYLVPQPVPDFGESGSVRTVWTREDTVFLAPASEVGPESKLQERAWKKGKVSIHTRFYWPPEPKGIVAGYTAPLQAWVETVLSGFTSRPIVLKGDYSQTYRPGHHNFWEDFVFDPWLEPGLDPGLLEELAAADLRAVVASGDPAELSILAVQGLNGEFRRYP